MKPPEPGRVKLAKRPSVLCRAVGSRRLLVQSGGGQVVDAVDVIQLDQAPGRPSSKSTCTSKPSKLSRTASVSLGRSLGWAPADRAAAAAVGFVQPGAEDPLELTSAGRVEAAQAQGPVTAAATPVAAGARLA